jgi:hypothetical protein
MKIDERITNHEMLRNKLYVKKQILEAELFKIEEKILFHNIAIHNLKIKKSKTEVMEIDRSKQIKR